MSGPLASWVQAHSKLRPIPRLMVTTLALRADHDGNGADHSHDQLAELTGYHHATVVRGLAEAMKASELEQVSRGGGRGHIARYRIPINWCDPKAGCFTCTTLRKAQGSRKGSQSATEYGRKGSHTASERVADRDPLRNVSRQLTQQQLARRAAETNRRASERHRTAMVPGGRSAPPDPLGSAASCRACLPNPSQEGSTAGNLPPFQAISPNGGLPRGHPAPFQAHDRPGYHGPRTPVRW